MRDDEIPRGCHSDEGKLSLDLKGQEEEQLSDLSKSVAVREGAFGGRVQLLATEAWQRGNQGQKDSNLPAPAL